MSRHLAHRPRYRVTRHSVQPSPRTRKEFFNTRWVYRHQTTPYQKRLFGQNILLMPIYRFVHGVMLR